MTKLALFQEGRLIQYSKSINVIHMTKEEKSHDHINQCTKSTGQNSTLFHDKNSQKIGI